MLCYRIKFISNYSSSKIDLLLSSLKWRPLSTTFSEAMDAGAEEVQYPVSGKVQAGF